MFFISQFPHLKPHIAIGLVDIMFLELFTHHLSLYIQAFLTESQASRYTIADEFNYISELSDLIRAKEREEENRIYQVNDSLWLSREVNKLVGKYLFADTIVNTIGKQYNKVTIIYMIMSVKGKSVNVTYSFSNDPTIRSGVRPF